MRLALSLSVIYAAKFTVAAPVDCILSDWSETAPCDPATGTRQITRSILQDSLNGGTPCDSIEYDTLLTSTETCTVDCILSDWSPSFCDQGTGVATRARSVVVNPLNGGAACDVLQESHSCLPETCETTAWAVAGACAPESCTQAQTRDMLFPDRDADLPCDLCQSVPCTLDAVMGPWTEWSECDATGHRTRSRDIVAPACNGGAAAEHTTETTTDSCGDVVCDSANNPWPVDVATGDDAWTPCNAVTGLQTRDRVLVAPSTGVTCETHQERACAVNCVLDSWSPWSECNECTGLQNRTRGVIHTDLNGGNQCGDTKEVRDCAVVCEASDWGAWSDPDESCVCHRSRTQLSPPLNGGECVLDDSDPTCPASCQVSDWGAPSVCQLDGPNAGQQLFTRKITQAPCNGGAACPDTTKWQVCDVDCVTSEWSDWSTCDLDQQLQTRTRDILQQPYNNGVMCGETTESRACGDCADLVGSFTYGDCDVTTGVRTGTAPLLHVPRNGQACTTTTTEPCDVPCIATDWVAGTCNPESGTQIFTREITQEARNDGSPCPADLVKTEDCVVDCVPGDEWLPWSDCNADGFSVRTHVIEISAQHGGSNEACQVEQVQTCAVDCVIDVDTGDVVQKSLNGGATCAEVAAAAQIPGDYSTKSESSLGEAQSTSFMATLAANKEYTMAALATGSVGILFLVALASTRRHSRGGYTSISRDNVL
ncbi:Aste57867_16292 [Aphanomyces stellatus]|uniref:Aste57867_16292 protein n=1 Tax=Aphanomyces stellatus TaxID=120398 RepID=A0A485L5X3_9STRA|nr:hypothetical protein As57867_016235 [Aphanomyces stellatus]VFT93068.1 Aste57867_16292 [Aphanomyces stellatus]